jgi:hypothetical protein
MRVRMKVGLSGTRDGKDWPPVGGSVDLPDDEAAHLVTAGLAAPDDKQPPVEEATAPPAETSTPQRRKPSAKR